MVKNSHLNLTLDDFSVVEQPNDAFALVSTSKSVQHRRRFRLVFSTTVTDCSTQQNRNLVSFSRFSSEEKKRISTHLAGVGSIGIRRLNGVSFYDSSSLFARRLLFSPRDALLQLLLLLLRECAQAFSAPSTARGAVSESII